MPQIFVALGKKLTVSFKVSGAILAIALVCLFGSLVTFSVPSYAANSSIYAPLIAAKTPDTNVKTNVEIEDRVEAYDEVVKEIQEPNGLEKVYEENLKEYKEENPNPSLVSEAKDLVKKVTGQDE